MDVYHTACYDCHDFKIHNGMAPVVPSYHRINDNISVEEKLQPFMEHANNVPALRNEYLSNGHIANVIPFATFQPNEMPTHEIRNKMANNKFYVQIK